MCRSSRRVRSAASLEPFPLDRFQGILCRLNLWFFRCIEIRFRGVATRYLVATSPFKRALLIARPFSLTAMFKQCQSPAPLPAASCQLRHSGLNQPVLVHWRPWARPGCHRPFVSLGRCRSLCPYAVSASWRWCSCDSSPCWRWGRSSLSSPSIPPGSAGLRLQGSGSSQALRRIERAEQIGRAHV